MGEYTHMFYILSILFGHILLLFGLVLLILIYHSIPLMKLTFISPWQTTLPLNFALHMLYFEVFLGVSSILSLLCSELGKYFLIEI